MRESYCETRIILTAKLIPNMNACVCVRRTIVTHNMICPSLFSINKNKMKDIHSINV